LLHIVSDSSCDLPEDYMKEHGINTVPLVIRIGNREYMEGVDISSREFYEKMKSSPVLPKTAQPSPAAFARVFDMLSRPGDEILCLTISSKLSGTFQSACIGQAMSTSNVTVFDTLAASSGHALQIMKAVELASRGFSVRQIVENLTKYRDSMKILILLDTLENIVKGGRLSRLQGTLARILNIKVLLQGVEGAVEPLEKIRGKKNFLERVLEVIGQKMEDFSDRLFYMTHVNNEEDAFFLENEITRRYRPKGVLVHPMGPTVSTYAGDRGIVLSY
jgi:DegV family protein with EDD domain